MTQGDAFPLNEPPVSYAAICCPYRDLVLLKSVIALSEAQGVARWQYVQSPQSSSSRPDLLVIGADRTDAQATPLLHNLDPEQVVLWIGEAPMLNSGHRVFQCKTPLHAFQLTEQLQQIVAVVRKYRQRSVLTTLPQDFLLQEAAAHTSLENLMVKLLRWPPVESFSRVSENEDRAFWRMASMLSARSMTVADLSRRTDCPRSICLEFLHRLSINGYVELQSVGSAATEQPALPEPKTAPASPAPGGMRGLLRRIRIGLGLASA